MKASLHPPLIIHTAATPMPIPKNTLFGDIPMACESRRGSSVSENPYAGDVKSMVRQRAFSNVNFIIVGLLHNDIGGLK